MTRLQLVEASMPAILSEAPSDQHPPRRFGFWSGLWVVVASMVGTGILTTSGIILHHSASHQVLLGLWLLGGLLSLAGALTLAEMATTLPEVGGEYIYVREAFGPQWAFLHGWATFILGFAAPTALIAQTAVLYLLPVVLEVQEQLFFTLVIDRAHLLAWGPSLIIVFFTVIHCLGHRESAWVQSATTVFKVIALVVLAILGLCCGSGSWENLTVSAPNPSSATLASGLVLVMYSYTGWNGATYLAGEIRDPDRNLPRCVVGGCVLVTLLYILLNLFYAYALDPRVFPGMSESTYTPIAELAAQTLWGKKVAWILSLAIGLGCLSTVSAFILTGPRVPFAMARDRLFPAFAGELHASTGAPVAATITLGLMALLFARLATLGELMAYAGIGLGAMACLVIACIFPLRKRAYPRIFSVPGYPWTPLLFLAISVWMVVTEFWNNPWIACLSLGSIGIAIPIYWCIFTNKPSSALR